VCCLGRHLAINSVRRLRECASLLTKGSAFQHVRSLDLGIVTIRKIKWCYWDDYLIILDAFARRHTLTRLWLSEVPFYFSKRGEKKRVTNIIASLTATVNELGLYSCRFSSYAEMISLIQSFPLCTSLYVRDCVARKTPGSNSFANLPQHTLYISDLELTSSLDYGSQADVSTLVKDAGLDVSSLTGFSCNMSTTDLVRNTLMSTTASPIERFQLICDEAEGFHVLEDPAVVSSWSLRSLIIGPIVQKDDRWCDRALNLNPNFPYLETVTVEACYPKQFQHSLLFWRRVDQILSREDKFPCLERLDICINMGPQGRRLPGRSYRSIVEHLPTLRGTGRVYFWGHKVFF